MANQPTFEAFAAAVMERLAAELRSGLSKAQSDWAWNAFQRFILPEYFRSGEPATEESLRAQVEMTADDILADWRALDGQGKWQWIVRKTYACRLEPLSREAFTLAEARYRKAAPGAEIAGRALKIRRLLVEIGEEMQRHAPAARRELADLISETTLDCLYAQGIQGGLSLRFSRLVKSSSTLP